MIQLFDEFAGVKEPTLVKKINEIIGVVNALTEENNIHERQIDELQMKIDPNKTRVYKEELIGCVVEYKDSYGNYKYGLLTSIKKDHDKYPYVLDNEKYVDDVWAPDESVYYKGIKK